MVSPCQDGYADELAEQYLRTSEGKGSQDPYGMWCDSSDVMLWATAVARIRRAVSESIAKAGRENIALPSPLPATVASWMFQSLRVPKPSVLHDFGLLNLCRDDVTKAVDFARAGVVILAKIHCRLEEGGSTPPDAVDTVTPDALGGMFRGFDINTALALAALVAIVIALKK